MLQWAFLAQKWDFSLTTELCVRERETLFSLFPGCCHVDLETCLCLVCRGPCVIKSFNLRFKVASDKKKSI